MGQGSTGFVGQYLANVADYVLWYARDRHSGKYRPLWRKKVAGAEGAAGYKSWESYRTLTNYPFSP